MQEKALTDASKCSGVSCYVKDYQFRSRKLTDIVKFSENPIVRDTGEFTKYIL